MIYYVSKILHLELLLKNVRVLFIRTFLYILYIFLKLLFYFSVMQKPSNSQFSKTFHLLNEV